MATTTAAVSPTTAPLRYRVSCLIAALLAVGSTRLGVNPVVGATLVADTALLFDAGKGGMVDVRRLADGVDLVDSAELVGGAELVVVVVTINNFSWPAVTV
jgi:hypothetical protein